MIIQLTDTIFYNSALKFEDQNQECIDFIRQYISEHTPEFRWDESNRPFEYVYGNSIWEIIKTQLWSQPSPSCAIYGEEITVKIIGDVWHDPDCVIRIKMSYENNISMLEQYPEFAMYRKEANIKTYMEYEYTYFYVNYIIPVHENLLKAFGAEITDKTNN